MGLLTLRIGISGFPGAGGSGIVAGELGRQLARRGHEIHFIGSGPPFRSPLFGERLFFHEARNCRIPASDARFDTGALASKMAEVSREFDLDILHAHYALPHAVAGILARGILNHPDRPRLVTTLHGTDVTGAASGQPLHDLASYCVRNSDALSCVSGFLRSTTLKTFPGIGRVSLVPNFVDLDWYRRTSPDCRKTASSSESELVLVHVSSFRPIKRAMDTVRVLATVNRTRPARLLLIGDGPQMSAVLLEGRRLGVRDRIQVLGRQVDVQPVLSGGDVFLLPSQQESFGLAALEALACGVPAVVSDVGGLPELVENGKSGYRVAVGDTDSMARRVLDLAADEAILEHHRKEARLRAMSFDARRIVPAYEELYRRTLA